MTLHASPLSHAEADPAVLIETVLTEITSVLANVHAAQVTDVADALLRAPHVLVAGEGRSGFMAKAFAMRLMHLGVPVHVVGETTTPAVTGQDAVVVLSGSGTTQASVRVATVAHDTGAAVVAVTTEPASPLAAVATTTLLVPAATKHRRPGEAATIQPLSSLFDQSVHILLDVVCLEIARRQGIGNDAANARHANTE